MKVFLSAVSGFFMAGMIMTGPALATADPLPTTRVAQVDSDPPSGGASR